MAEEVPVGTVVHLKVTFGGTTHNFYVSGRVVSAGETLQEGNGVNVLIEAPDELKAFEHLVAFCARNQQAARRFPASIDCKVQVGSEAIPAKIRDVSITGAFIAGRQARSLKEGALVQILLKGGLFGLGAPRLTARVVWCGVKRSASGFGAHFEGTPQEEVLELLRKHGLRPG